MNARTPKSLSRPAAERHWIADWTVTFLILLFGTTTVLQAYVVPTGSMTGTMLIGDYILVDKLAYAPAGSSLTARLLPYQDVRRGDIIVFRYPLDLKQNYVKRVIGIPGDRLRLQDNRLVLNGRYVEEPYLRLDLANQSDYMRNFPQMTPDAAVAPRAVEMLARHVNGNELVVPPNQYFALGDNRDQSADSRFWGFVPRENIIGKPALIFWSYDAPTEQLTGGLLNPRHALDVALHFFTRTRWDRSLRLVQGYSLGY